jgi:hypothetical protein
MCWRAKFQLVVVLILAVAVIPETTELVMARVAVAAMLATGILNLSSTQCF